VTSTLVVARKELLDLRRNRFMALLLGFILVAVTLSVIVGAAQFRVKLDEFHQYVAALKASGSTVTAAAPQLYPLQLLRGSIEYIQLIGALFAIVVGYGMVAKEKQRATIELLFSRPVSRYSVAGGKLLALAVTWLVAVAVVFAAVIGVLLVVGRAPLQPVDAGRLLIAAAVAWAYLLLWSSVAMALASSSKHLSTGLIAVLVLWLVVVLIVPQIGDTMDPDNQVPGGLFKSLQIAKPDEKAVLAHFAGYDTVRNGLEVTSVTKHFERLSFAFLGIKDTFNQLPIATVARQTLTYSLSLVLASAAAVVLALVTTTRKRLLRRNS
jgi:ABC-2 type transport system permease protein